MHRIATQASQPMAKLNLSLFFINLSDTMAALKPMIPLKAGLPFAQFKQPDAIDATAKFHAEPWQQTKQLLGVSSSTL